MLLFSLKAVNQFDERFFKALLLFIYKQYEYKSLNFYNILTFQQLVLVENTKQLMSIVYFGQGCKNYFVMRSILDNIRPGNPKILSGKKVNILIHFFFLKSNLVFNTLRDTFLQRERGRMGDQL